MEEETLLKRPLRQLNAALAALRQDLSIATDDEKREAEEYAQNLSNKVLIAKIVNEILGFIE